MHLNFNINAASIEFTFPTMNESLWNSKKQYLKFNEYKIKTSKSKLFEFFEKYSDGLFSSFKTTNAAVYFYNNEKEISATIFGVWPSDFYETSNKYRNINVSIKGSVKDVHGLSEAFEAFFFESLSDKKQVKWYDEGPYGIEVSDIFLKENEKFVTEFYPFIENLYEWIDGFFKSDKNVLILVGEPGTGKSSLLREMLQRSDYESYLTYNKPLMEKDSLYRKFFNDVSNSNSQKGVLILEDADLILLDREDSSNFAMSKLLNISDGIIENPDMKFIFTANLDDISKIDKALTRPGRCYDILEFRKLTQLEADIAAEKAGINFDKPSGSFTVAEIYNNSKNKVESKRAIGF